MTTSVIFDLDGTVIDNEGEWERAFQHVVNSYQLPINKDFKLPNNWIHEPGLGLVNNWRRILGGDNKKAEELVPETFAAYRKIMEETGVILPRDGMGALIDRIKENGWATALCTGSFWTVVEPELEALKLYLAFDITTTGEEVLMQKPDPEIFILTAQKIGCEPEEAIVIEDAVAGVRAAAEAGMQTIGLVSPYAPEDTLKAAGATWTVESLEDCLKIFADIKANQKEFEQ